MANLWPDVADLERQVNDWTKYFGIKNMQGPHKSDQDKNAFAHAYSSAQLVYDGGEFYSDLFGEGREYRSFVTDSYKALNGTKGYTVKGVFLDGNRDEYNNEVGQEVAKYALANGLPREAIGYLIADALRNGLLISDEGRDSRNILRLSVDEYNGPSAAARGALEKMFGVKLDIRCFPATTPIQTSLTTSVLISDIRIGDTVLAFDPTTDLGRGALVPRRVTRLFRNVTEAWVKLTWTDPVSGDARELVATPGHHFLDQFGKFPPIEPGESHMKFSWVADQVRRDSMNRQFWESCHGTIGCSVFWS